jgi:hypothetical protein
MLLPQAVLPPQSGELAVAQHPLIGVRGDRAYS